MQAIQNLWRHGSRQRERILIRDSRPVPNSILVPSAPHPIRICRRCPIAHQSTAPSPEKHKKSTAEEHAKVRQSVRGKHHPRDARNQKGGRFDEYRVPQHDRQGFVWPIQQRAGGQCSKSQAAKQLLARVDLLRARAQQAANPVDCLAHWREEPHRRVPWLHDGNSQHQRRK